MKQQIIDTVKTGATSGASFFAVDGVAQVTSGHDILDTVLKILVVIPAIIQPVKSIIAAIKGLFKKSA